MILLFDRKLFAIEIASSLLIDGELTGTSTFDNLKVLNIPITNMRAIPIIFGFLSEAFYRKNQASSLKRTGLTQNQNLRG